MKRKANKKLKAFSFLIILLIISQSLVQLCLAGTSFSVGNPEPRHIEPEITKSVPQRIFFPVTITKNIREVVDISCSLPDEIESYYLLPFLKQDKALYVMFVSKQGISSSTRNRKISCNLVYKGEDNRTQQEKLDFLVPFESLELGTIRDNIEQKLRDARQNMLVKQKWITDALDLFNNLKKVCNLFGVLAKISKLMNSVKPLVYITSVSSYYIGGDSLWQSYCTATKSVDRLKNTFWDRAGLNFMKKACALVSCSQCLGISDYIGLFGDKGYTGKKGSETTNKGKDKKLLEATSNKDWLGNFLTEISGADGFLAGEFYHLTPESSIVYSAACLCVPGILYHLNSYRQIECRYIECLESSLQNGLNPELCEQARGISYCRKITGEAFSLFPWTNIVDNVFKWVIKLINNAPLGAAGAGIDYVVSFLKQKAFSQSETNSQSDTSKGQTESILASIGKLISWLETSCTNYDYAKASCHLNNPTIKKDIVCSLWHAYLHLDEYKAWSKPENILKNIFPKGDLWEQTEDSCNS